MQINPLGLMIIRVCEEQRLRDLFQDFSRDELRLMWDNLGDDSFFGPYDCADIHLWMNLTGDGAYCAI